MMDCEFNAPKYVDFNNFSDSYTSDNWFDDRPGDEGGISEDLVPLYEDRLGQLPSAILAGLPDVFGPSQNSVPENPVTKTPENAGEGNMDNNNAGESKVDNNAGVENIHNGYAGEETIDNGLESMEIVNKKINPSKRKLPKTPTCDVVSIKRQRANIMPQRACKTMAQERLKAQQTSTRKVCRPVERVLHGDTTHSNEKKPTKPLPFKFVLPDKMKVPVPNFQSVAEQCNKFQSETRTRSQKFKPLRITKPVTPQLLTGNRRTRKVVESAKEIEDRTVEAMKSYQFKATEINPKVMDMKGLYGVKPVAPPAKTEQKPFSFTTDYSYRHVKKSDTKENEGSSVEKTKKPLRPTVPQPFSFENRDRERWQKKEEKIKSQLAEERKIREFQASSLPSSSPDALPTVPAKKATRLKPFNISDGSAAYQAKYHNYLKDEEERERLNRQFKAQSAAVVKKQPFQPVTGLIPPTNISNITLNTDIRAAERENLQHIKSEKEKRLEEQRAQIERENKLAEEAEIRELRKNAVHKARPMPIYKPIEIKKSEVPLTQPRTPNLQVKRFLPQRPVGVKVEKQL